jgi:hypothetical protein
MRCLQIDGQVIISGLSRCQNNEFNGPGAWSAFSRLRNDSTDEIKSSLIRAGFVVTEEELTTLPAPSQNEEILSWAEATFSEACTGTFRDDRIMGACRATVKR